MQSRALELATQIAGNAPIAVQAAKQLIDAGLGNALALDVPLRALTGKLRPSWDESGAFFVNSATALVVSDDDGTSLALQLVAAAAVLDKTCTAVADSGSRVLGL